MKIILTHPAIFFIGCLVGYATRLAHAQEGLPTEEQLAEVQLAFIDGRPILEGPFTGAWAGQCTGM